jgi:membrane-associated protease RseP (regulator of RpoE activity)
MKKSLLVLAASAALCATAAIAGSTGDAQDPAKDKTVEKRVVVRADVEKGEPRVFVWEGKDGAHQLLSLGRGFLGVQLIDITEPLRKHLGAPEKNGVLVGEVEKDSPAEKAGIQVGDVLVSVDGEGVAWSGEVGRQVRQKKEGDMAKIELVRDGRSLSVDVAVAERDAKRRVMRRIEGPEGRGIEIDIEGLDDLGPMIAGPAMDHAREAMRMAEGKMQMRMERTQEMEKRLQELERKLQELQKKLEEKNR